MKQFVGSLDNLMAPRASHPATQRPAIFGSIEKVARVERQKMFGPTPEPVEVQISRYQASEEARRVIADAFEMADLIRAEAQRNGFDAGWAEGYASGKTTAETECRAEKSSSARSTARTWRLSLPRSQIKRAPCGSTPSRRSSPS